MIKKFLTAFSILFLVSISPALAAETVLVIGDSISLGAYPCNIRDLVGVDRVRFVGNTNGCGVPVVAEVGKGSAYMTQKAIEFRSINSENIDKILIMLGSNDINGVDPSQIKANLERLARIFNQNGRVYISQIPPQTGREAQAAAINSAISSIDPALAAIVDQSDLTTDLLTDGLHPDSNGHKIIACNIMKLAWPGAPCQKPKVAKPKTVLPAKIPTRGKKCPTGDSLGFAPLRPDPGEPCEEYVPAETKFTCGTSLTPIRQRSFNPYGEGEGCEKNPDGTVTCLRQETFNVSINLNGANLGILGNTQDQNLTDEQKVNEYLSWYLSGVPQVGDQKTINSKKEEDIDRLINFSGPIRKLLPYDLGAVAKATIADQQSKTVHNYIVGPKDPIIGFFEGKNPLDPNIRLKDYQDENIIQKAAYWIDPTLFGPKLVRELINNNLLERLFQNISFSSLEDTVGEYVVSATDVKRVNLQDPSIKDGTVHLIINSSRKAP